MNYLNETQKKGVEKLKSKKGVALFCEPGTGKTRMAIALTKEKGYNSCVIISNKDNQKTFEEEIKKIENEYNIKINLKINTLKISSFSSDKKFIEIMKKYKNIKNNILIFDETLYIKNSLAKRTKNVTEFSKMFNERIILNGTPISKNYADLYSQFEFLNPKILNMSEPQFIYNYCNFDLVGYRNDFKIIGFKNIDQLLKKISNYVYESKLNLDVKKENKTIFYKVFKDKEWLDLFYKLEDDFFSSFIKLQQLQNCNVKFESFKNLVSELNGNLIINCSFLYEIYKIKEIMEKLQYKIFLCTGQKKEIEEFKKHKGKKVLLKTWQSGSFGLNLQKDCNIMLNFSKNFDLSIKLQAERRIYRTGQENNVIIYDFECINGIDFIFNKCIDKKIKMYDYVMQNFKNISDEQYQEYLNSIDTIFFEKNKRNRKNKNMYSETENNLIEKFNNEKVETIKFNGIKNKKDEYVEEFINKNDLSVENIEKLYQYYKKNGINLYYKKFKYDEEKIKNVLNYKDDNFKSNNIFNRLYLQNEELHKAKNFKSLSLVDRITNSKYLKKAIMIALIQKKSPLEILDFWGNKPTNFNPVRAFKIYDKYLNVNEKNAIVDPCFGFGGRILGAYLLAKKYPKKIFTYTGYDVNENSKKFIIDFMKELPVLNNFKWDLFIKSAELVNYSNFDLLFTSPPYFTTEIYEENNKNQSTEKYKNYDEWIQMFLTPLIKNDCNQIILNVTNTKQAPTLEEEVSQHLKFKNHFKISNIKNEKLFIKKDTD